MGARLGETDDCLLGITDDKDGCLLGVVVEYKDGGSLGETDCFIDGKMLGKTLGKSDGRNDGS